LTVVTRAIACGLRPEWRGFDADRSDRGGPGGLYFAALTKQLDPRHEITVWERNAATDTLGFGVVLSDETLRHRARRSTIYQAMSAEFAQWTTSTCTIAVRSSPREGTVSPR
jgi:hypothetical protein